MTCHAVYLLPPPRRGSAALGIALAAAMAAAAVPPCALARPPRARAPTTTTVPARAGEPEAPDGADGSAAVDHAEGRRLRVSGVAVARWPVGMPVVVREPGPAAAALVVAAGVVTAQAGERAVVLLEEGAPALPQGARVEPRYLAEARAYGAGVPRQQATGGAPGAGGDPLAAGPAAPPPRPPPRPQVWHTVPDSVPFGGSLWLEVVATAEYSALVVRWRLGRQGPFAEVPMRAGADGRWTATLAIGEPDPEIEAVEYYIGATLTVAGEPARAEVIVGHAAEPRRVALASAPGAGRRPVVDHQPPARWTDHKALAVLARVDRRFREPTLLFRARGGGSFEAVPMQRVSGDLFRATIPAERVVVPGIAYTIRVTDARGLSRDGFASDAEPWQVAVTRGTVLSPEDARNRVHAGVAIVRYDGADDGYTRGELGLERMFFGFLVGRLVAEATLGRAPRLAPGAAPGGPLMPERLRLYGGSAGLEVRLGDYVGATIDLLMAIHRDGAGVGFAAGARIGDEAGSHITADWRTLRDLDSDAGLVEQLRVALSVPVGRSLRLDGVVVHEDVVSDASKGLRFAVEAGVPIGARLWAVATAGFAGRDADRPGATGALRLALTF